MMVSGAGAVFVRELKQAWSGGGGVSLPLGFFAGAWRSWYAWGPERTDSPRSGTLRECHNVATFNRMCSTMDTVARYGLHASRRLEVLARGCTRSNGYGTASIAVWERQCVPPG